MSSASATIDHIVHVPAASVALEGNLSVPPDARGLVLFAHGSGSSRHSPRNRYVAERLHKENLATLLIDLLTAEEERVDQVTAELRFDIRMLAGRLISATDWLHTSGNTSALPLGYFGASTGAAAALSAAAERPDLIAAVVSRGGRPDLAGSALSRVRAPTLLVVGGADTQVIEINRSALALLRSEKKLVIVPGATHLFQEPGALDDVADLAIDWFLRHLGSRNWRESLGNGARDE